MLAGDLVKALECFEKVIVKEPDNFETLQVILFLFQTKLVKMFTIF